MRRIGMIFIGIFGIWLGGCVAETQVPETTGTTEELSETGGEQSAHAGVGGGDLRMRADVSKVGSARHSLQIAERPPPQPYHAPEPTPPTPPAEGK